MLPRASGAGLLLHFAVLAAHKVTLGCCDEQKNPCLVPRHSGTFEELDGNPESFTSEDTFEIPFNSPAPSTAMKDLEAVGHRLLDKCRAPRILVLKVGARVMLIQVRDATPAGVLGAVSVLF